MDDPEENLGELKPMDPQASAATRIRFKNSKMTRIVGVAMASFFLWAAGLLLLHPGHRPITAVVVVLLLLVGTAICLLGAYVLSDIVVDAHGMRRRLFGLDLGGISWTQMVGVRVFHRWNSNVESRGRYILFDRVHKPKWHLRLGTLSFMDNGIVSADEVTPVLNKYIAAHNINIEEISEEGLHAPLTRL